VTNGDPQATSDGATTYDFTSGLPSTPSLRTWEAVVFLRCGVKAYPTRLADGRKRDGELNDANMTASFTKPGLGTNTSTYDGFGRVIQSVDANTGSEYELRRNGRWQAERIRSLQEARRASTGYTYDVLGE